MRFIPTIVHGITDYAVGIVVIALPFIFGTSGLARDALVVLGALVIVYSFCTDYELGAVRFLSVRFHLFLDFIFGLTMLTLPWLVALQKDLATVVLVIGLLAITLVFITKETAKGNAAG